MLAAARLRHRVRIETPTRTQDPMTGELVTTWAELATVAAAIEPLSVKDVIAAQQARSEISARIVIRWRSGLTHACRLIDTRDGTAYTPAGFLADPETGREYLTIPAKVTT